MQYVSCSFCGLQQQQSHTLPCDTPVYQQHSDSIKLVSKRICKSCSQIIMNMQHFVKQSQSQFCSHKFKSHIFEYYPFLQITNAKKSMQLVYATSVQEVQRSRKSSQLKRLGNTKRISMSERSSEQQKEQTIHPYISWLIEQIIHKNYLTMQHFSKTLQYFIYLTSGNMVDRKNMKIVVSAEERHEKVKNIILFLSEKINVSVEELPDVLFMVNFLLCFMDASKTINVIIQLSNILIVYPHLLTWKTLLIDHQERPNMQTPLSPATFDMKTSLILVDRLWPKVQYIIDISRRGQSMFRQGLIRMSKLDENLDFKQYRKKLSQSLKLLLARKQQLQYFNEEQLQLLYLLKEQKNNFNLILKETMEQQENVRIQINRLEHKFRLEKDQYIETIVKLSNKVEELETSLRLLADHNSSKVNGDRVSVQGQKSINLGCNGQKEGMVVSQSQRQGKGKGSYASQISAKLEEIVTVTNLGVFNHKHNISDKQPDTYTNLEGYLIDQISKMQQCIVKLSHKFHKVHEEKTHLLQIITRKQQRLLGVIMQKDTIIERYQQALWTLQNGLIVTEGPLTHRIQYIMHVFAKKAARQAEIAQMQPQAMVQEKEVNGKKDKGCEIY